MILSNGWAVSKKLRMGAKYGPYSLKFIVEGMEQGADTQDWMLSVMLLNEVVFTNGFWWKKMQGWSEKDRELTGCFVNLNDVFAWACSDAEDLPHAEIDNLFRHWLRDPDLGPAVWAAKQRKMLPQKHVLERIEKAGIWDLKELEGFENA
jgi:hypothetical protein